jgi:hypothetical protein
MAVFYVKKKKGVGTFYIALFKKLAKLSYVQKFVKKCTIFYVFFFFIIFKHRNIVYGSIDIRDL